MINFGSEIKIFGPYKGIHKNVKYRHIASCNHDYPNLIKLREHPKWFKLGDKGRVKKLIQICSHEPIHNIITHYMIGYSLMNTHGYDILISKFKKRIKKECPKTHRDYSTF
jgi:hypothetical protein